VWIDLDGNELAWMVVMVGIVILFAYLTRAAGPVP